MSFRFAFKTSFGHLQDVLVRCLACLEKTSCRCLFADWEGYSLGKSSSAYKKYEYGHLGRCYIKSVLYKRFLNWNKIFKKNSYYWQNSVFCDRSIFTHHSNYLNIGFWYGSFVWKSYVFKFKSVATNMRYFASSKFLVHKKNFSLMRQAVFKLEYVYCQEK